MFGRNRKPCVPKDVEAQLLREVYEEAMAYLNRVEVCHYSWRLVEDISEIRTHVSLEVSRRLHRGELKAKIEAAGYRLCTGS